MLPFLHWTFRSSIASRSLRGPNAGWQISMPNVQLGGRIAKRCSGDCGVNGMQGDKCEPGVVGTFQRTRVAIPVERGLRLFLFWRNWREIRVCAQVMKRKAENWRRSRQTREGLLSLHFVRSRKVTNGPDKKKKLRLSQASTIGDSCGCPDREGQKHRMLVGLGEGRDAEHGNPS